MKRSLSRLAIAGATVLAATALPWIAAPSADAVAPVVQVGAGGGPPVYYDLLSPRTIPVSGSGWTPGSVVEITVDDGGTEPAQQLATAGDDGTYSVDVAVDPLRCQAPAPAREERTVSTHGVSADGGHDAMVSSTFTVACPRYGDRLRTVPAASGVPAQEVCVIDEATGLPVTSDGDPLTQPVVLQTDLAGRSVREPVSILRPGPACATYVPKPDEQDAHWTVELDQPDAAPAATSHAVLAPRAPSDPQLTIDPACGESTFTVPGVPGVFHTADVRLTITASNLPPLDSDDELGLFAEGPVSDFIRPGADNGGNKVPPVTMDPSALYVQPRLSDFQWETYTAPPPPPPSSQPSFSDNRPSHVRQALPVGTSSNPDVYTIYLIIDHVTAPKAVRGAADPVLAPRALPPGAPADAPADTVAVATFSAPCPPPPTLQITSPNFSVPSSDPIVTVAGSGYLPLKEVDFTGATPVDAGGIATTVIATASGALPAGTRVRLPGSFGCSSAYAQVRAGPGHGYPVSNTAFGFYRCSTITLTPATFNKIDEPQDVQVRLTGFDAFTSVTVTAPGVVDPVTHDTDAAGRWNYPLPEINNDCDPPLYTVRAVETSAVYSVPPHNTTSFQVLCPTAPLITPTTPFATARGTRTFTAAIDGVPRSSSVDVTLVNDAHPSPAMDSQTIATPAAAGPVTYTSPGFKNLDCGTYTLRVQPSGGSLPAGAATFTVTCPQLLLSRNNLGQQDLPATITVTGSGFDPDSQLSLTVPGVATAQPVTTDDFGAWSSKVFIGVGAPCGTGAATATRSDGLPTDGPVSAATPLSIDCGTGASLTVTPSTFATSTGSRLLHFTSSGLIPGRAVEFVLDGTSVSGTGTAVADASGAVTDDLEILAPPAGLHTLLLVQQRLPTPETPTVSLCAADECQDPLRSASALLTVTTPALTPNPASFSRDDSPSTEEISGTGWDPGTDLLIFLPTSQLTARTDADGAFSTTADPSLVPCGGAVPVQAREDYPSLHGVDLSTVTRVSPDRPAIPPPTASSSVSVTCPNAPSAAISPGTFAIAGSPRAVRLTGSSFRPSTSVTVTTIPDPSGTPVTLGVVTTGSDGTLTLPTSLTPRTCGQHGVLLTPTVGYNAVADYVVTCPVLTVQPSRVVKGDTTPDPGVVGSGYDPFTHVALRIGGDTKDRIVATTSGSGTFNVTLPLGDERCATVATTGIEVGTGLNPPPSASGPLTISCLTLELSPGVVNDGEVAEVRGGGFTPGTTVSLSWQLPEHSTPSDHVEEAVTPDKHGAFDVQLLVMSHDTLGPRRLVAISTLDGVISAPLLVVANAFQPGGQDTFNPARRGLVSRR